ncbi:MAG: alginate lyase family protein [Candidatus Kapabacteria bacterium]|nr:alginate lyase family protein [Candidatus Kapabacteria bacterium]
MKIFNELYKFRVLPLSIGLRKLLFFISNKFLKKNSLLSNSVRAKAPDWLSSDLKSYIRIPNSNFLSDEDYLIKNISTYFLRHKFMLLSAQWQLLDHNASVLGFEEYLFRTNEAFLSFDQFIEQKISSQNREFSKTVCKLIPITYNFIDWQRDFKSGYRWDESVESRNINFGIEIGADIKVPWELGRMQHLLILTYSAIFSLRESKLYENNKIYLNEIQNQILDFIAFNPTGYGVQWMTAMDIAIRATNWIICYNLLVTSNFHLSREFEDIFKLSLLEHAREIVKNPEWSQGLRGNHYLTAIAGLLIIAAYLPVSDETSEYLIYSLQELLNEIEYQFADDGSNFEASTSYHLLTAEIINFAILTANSLCADKLEGMRSLRTYSYKFNNKIKSFSYQKFKIIRDQIIFDISVLNKIKKINDFSITISVNNPIKGFLHPRFGDNDSGCFIPVIPSSKETVKNHFSHFPSDSFANTITFYDFFSLAQNNNLQEFLKLQTDDSNLSNIETGSSSIKLKAFKDFGLYIYYNKNYQLYIRCGSIGQRGKGGHSHNDQLSIIVFAHGLELIVDAGTFTYTAIPELRNKYRSTNAHNTLGVRSMEQNIWVDNSIDDLFWIRKHRSRARCTKFDEDSFEGIHFGFNKPHKRNIIPNESSIMIKDSCQSNKPKEVYLHFHPDIHLKKYLSDEINCSKDATIAKVRFSNADVRIETYYYSGIYGVRQEAQRLVFSDIKKEFLYEIEIL